MGRGACQHAVRTLYRNSMSDFTVKLPLGRMGVFVCALCCIAMPVQSVLAQTDKGTPAEKPASPEKPADKSALPPLPAEAHTQQSIELDGKTQIGRASCRERV